MNYEVREDIYQESKKRGIKLRLGTIERLYKKGWTKEEILSYKDNTTFKERESYFIKRAQKNGINLATYKSRRYSGWSKERAATTPIRRAKVNERKSCINAGTSKST